MPAAARTKLCSSVSAWLGVFASIAVIGVVGVGNCFSGVISASFLCQLEAVSRQIHLPRKQRLINRKGHRRAVNKGMESHQ